MSGSLGGRQRGARAPQAAVPRRASPVGMSSCCGYDDDLGTIANNPATPTPEGRSVNRNFSPASGSDSANPCSDDMAISATIVNWDGDTQGDNSLELQVRQSTTSPFGAAFNVEDIAAGGNARYYLDSSSVGTGTSNHVDLPKPAPGDVLKVDIVGSTATAYKNGSSILTKTLSLSMPATFQPVASAAVLAGGSGAGPYEVRATVAFTSFC